MRKEHGVTRNKSNGTERKIQVEIQESGKTVGKKERGVKESKKRQEQAGRSTVCSPTTTIVDVSLCVCIHNTHTHTHLLAY